MTTSRILVLILSLAAVTTVLANDFQHPPTRTDTYDHAIRIQAGADLPAVIPPSSLPSFPPLPPSVIPACL